jgi:drug/metabolite transporter (DMT)-like permease
LAVAGASQVAAFLYLEPLVTLVVAAWLIGETVTWATLLGGAIILAGVWLVNQREAPARCRATSTEPRREI